MIICNTTNSGGTQAAVGGLFDMIEHSSDGVVIGPVSAIDSNIMLFDGATGKVAKDSNISSIDGNISLGIGKAYQINSVNLLHLGAGSLAGNLFMGNGGSAITTATNTTSVGLLALNALTTGVNNAAFGYYALSANTTGSANLAIGYQALRDNITGNSNLAIGGASMLTGTTGEANVGVGISTLRNLSSGAGNVVVGFSTARSNTSGGYNVAMGYYALYANSTGSRNIAIGSFAGRYETGDDAFYVDNQDRTDTAGDKSKALLYGTFNAAPTSQTLTVNGILKAGIGQFQLVNKPAPVISFIGDGTDFLGYGNGITFDGAKNYYFTIKNSSGGDTTGLRIQANGVVVADSFLSGYIGTSAWATGDTFGRVEGTKGYIKFGTNLEDVIKMSAVVPGNGYTNYLSMFRLVSPEPTLRVAIIQGIVGQSANLLEIRDSTEAVMASISASSTLTINKISAGNAIYLNNASTSTTFGIVVGDGASVAAGQVLLTGGGNGIIFQTGAIAFTAASLRVSSANNVFSIHGGFGGATAGNSVLLSANTGNAGNFTATTGTQNTVLIGKSSNNTLETWSPVSGTATYNMLAVTQGVNTSGSYSGTVRSIFVDPTLTSLTGCSYRAIEMSNNAGYGIYQSGALAINYFAGATKFNNGLTINRTSEDQNVMSIKTLGSAPTPTTAGVKGEIGTYGGYLHLWIDTAVVIRSAWETSW